MAATILQNQVLHVRFGGRSLDMPLVSLDLSRHSGDAEVKQRVAEYLEVRTRDLVGLVLDRHPNGNMTLRPEAVFG